MPTWSTSAQSNKTWADTAAEIDALLAGATGTFNGGVIVVGYDQATGNVALYYDADANTLGGVTQLVTLTGVGNTSTLGPQTISPSYLRSSKPADNKGLPGGCSGGLFFCHSTVVQISWRWALRRTQRRSADRSG